MTSSNTSRSWRRPSRHSTHLPHEQQTADEMLLYITGLMDGTYADSHVSDARLLFVYDKTIDEYQSTGDITSVSEADFN